MLSKQRDEQDVYEINFASDLSSGETISSIDSIKILTQSDVDVSTQFRTGMPTPVINGAKAQFWLKAAAGTDQAVGRYRVYCKITTSLGRTIEAANSVGSLPSLDVNP
jgi:hypothetical protein